MNNNNSSSTPLQRRVGALDPLDKNEINEYRKNVEKVRLGLISIKNICTILNIVEATNHFEEAILNISSILNNIDLGNQSGGKKKLSSKKPKTAPKKKLPTKKCVIKK